VTQYDSPAHFDAEKTAPLLAEIRTILKEIQSSAREGSVP
jgi:hypothetical protein